MWQLRISLEEMKQVVEPAGAIALAALLSPAFQELKADAKAAGAPLRSVAAISCGGNVAVELLPQHIAPQEE